MSSYFETSSGFKLPAFGLGTWQLRVEEVEEVVKTALATGYRHIDTSKMFENEAVIGNIINAWIDEGRGSRQELFISSKVPNYAKTPHHVEMYFMDQLEKLKVDYLDLYLLHFPVGIKCREFMRNKKICVDKQACIIDIWRKMEKLVDCGKINHLGLSNVNIEQLERVLHFCRIPPVNVQIECHPYNPQIKLINYCKSKDITITAFAPLGSPGYNYFFVDIGLDPKMLPPVLFDLSIYDMAKKYDRTSAQIMLRHTLQKGVAVIPQSSNVEHVEENIQIFDFVLRKEDVAVLDYIKTTIITSVSALGFIPLPLNPEEEFGLIEQSNTTSSGLLSSSEEEVDPEDSYFTKMFTFQFSVSDVTIETNPPNRIIIRGHKNIYLHRGEGPPRRFIRTFLLPLQFSIDKIVAYLSEEEVLTVTTEPWPKKGQFEVPIYFNEDTNVV